MATSVSLPVSRSELEHWLRTADEWQTRRRARPWCAKGCLDDLLAFLKRLHEVRKALRSSSLSLSSSSSFLLTSWARKTLESRTLEEILCEYPEGSKLLRKLLLLEPVVAHPSVAKALVHCAVDLVGAAASVDTRRERQSGSTA